MGRTEPRRITPEVLDDLAEWVRTSTMFHSSPEGRAFGQEMQEVIKLAREALATPGGLNEKFGVLQP